ncbi:hypothetical protein Tco_1502688 [Tanacetum coccineum]
MRSSNALDDGDAMGKRVCGEIASNQLWVVFVIVYGLCGFLVMVSCLCEADMANYIVGVDLLIGGIFGEVYEFSILAAIMKLVIMKAILDKLVALDVMIMGTFLNSLRLRISVNSGDQELDFMEIVLGVVVLSEICVSIKTTPLRVKEDGGILIQRPSPVAISDNEDIYMAAAEDNHFASGRSNESPFIYVATLSTK